MPKDKVLRVPVLVDGMPCPICHQDAGKWVYTFVGHTPWRCWKCLRLLARKIIDLRKRAEAEDNRPAHQPRGY